MGANNWTICPRCKVKHANATAKQIDDTNKQYGKIAADEFVKLRQKAIDFAAKKPDETLREDYGVGMDSNGLFSITYNCSCNVCYFRFKFRHEEQSKIYP